MTRAPADQRAPKLRTTYPLTPQCRDVKIDVAVSLRLKRCRLQLPLALRSTFNLRVVRPALSDALTERAPCWLSPFTEPLSPALKTHRFHGSFASS